jgi:hypothetical protein
MLGWTVLPQLGLTPQTFVTHGLEARGEGGGEPKVEVLQDWLLLRLLFLPCFPPWPSLCMCVPSSPLMKTHHYVSGLP